MLPRDADHHLVFGNVVSRKELLQRRAYQLLPIRIRLREDLGVFDVVVGEKLNLAVGTLTQLDGL